MRSILLNIDSDDGLEARFQASLDLARAFDGHVTCLQTISYDVAVPGDLYGSMIAEILPVLRENANAMREKLVARLEDEDVRWDWLQDEGPSGLLLVRRSALADVVLLGAREPAGGKRQLSGLVGHAAIHGGAPLLVMPDTVTSFMVGGTAVAGWNGSVEAARALRAALPLLRRASSVVLATVAEAKERGEFDLPPMEGAEYLSRHGIECEIVEFPLESESVARALANAAVARHASLLVMGAYGHPRAFETVFGGVTRELLVAPPLPILATH